MGALILHHSLSGRTERTTLWGDQVRPARTAHRATHTGTVHRLCKSPNRHGRPDAPRAEDQHARDGGPDNDHGDSDDDNDDSQRP